MTDFLGSLAQRLISGPQPDANAGTPKPTGLGTTAYPSGPWNPIGATPTLVPFERVAFLDLDSGAGVTQLVDAQVGPGVIRGNGHISQQIQAEWFEKWHVFPGELALGNVLTTQIRELEIFNAFRNEARTWEAFTNNAGAGISITNLPSLPRVFAALESFINTVQVSTAGPPNINGTFDFDIDLDPPDVIIVPVTGNRITIFQFRPQAPIGEELNFKTDIIRAFDGTEQRLSLREAPRQRISFTVRVDDNRTRDAINAILFDWQARVFGVPIWWEAKALNAPLTPTDTTVQVDTADADFRAGGLVTIYDSNFESQSIEIAVVNPTSLELQVPVGRAFDAIDTLIIPTRTAYTKAALQNSRYAIGPADYRLEFEVLDNVDLSANGFPTYQGIGQTTAKPLLDGFNFMNGSTIGEGNRQEVIRLDHETGPFLQFSPWAKGKPLFQFGFEAKSFADTWKVRQFLHFIRGSQLAFYVPTGRTDFKPLADIADNDTQIDFPNYGFDQFVSGITPRSDLRVLRKDGTTSLHQITGTSVVNNDVERVNISPGITPALPLADLDRIELVTLSRLADDKARLVHRRPGETRIDVALLGVPS